MPVPIPSQLQPGSNEFVVIVEGQIVDDITGSPVGNLTIRWDWVSGSGGQGQTTHGYTDAQGNYAVRLTTLQGTGTFSPTVYGHLHGITVTMGGSNISTTTVVGTHITRTTRNMRVIRHPAAPTADISGVINRHESNSWTNTSTITVQPFFLGGLYTESDIVRRPDTPDEDGDGQGIHVRYLWGGLDFTSSDVQASGLPYHMASGILTLPLEHGFTNTQDELKDEVYPSGSRYFNFLTEASGVAGSAYSNLVRHPVKYDSGDPPQPDVLYASGAVTNSTVVSSGIVDSVTGTEIQYRFANTTLGYTSAWASGTMFQQSGLTENTSYTVNVQARDAAGNIGLASDNTIGVVVTLVDPPNATQLAIEPVRESGNSEKARITIAKFTNDTSGLSGYRFRRWNGKPADFSVASVADSGWITSNIWDDVDLVSDQTYTWGVQYRNQYGEETSLVARTQSHIPVPTPPVPDIALAPRPTLVIPRDKSPLLRQAIRFTGAKVESTTYRASSVFFSSPYELTEAAYMVEMDLFATLPSTYPPGPWIQVSVSPDGMIFHPLVPRQMQGNPKVLIFNSFMTDREKRLAMNNGWLLITREEPVKSLIVRIELARPTSEPDTSPIIEGYRLIVTGRSQIHALPVERGIAPQARSI